MEETIKKIIEKAKKKIQKLDTERILCYTVDVNYNILSGRTVSRNNQKGFSYLDINKLNNMLFSENVFYVVILHNHPRNTMFSSNDDDELTKYVNDLCEENGMYLYDHIIIMKDNDDVYSYRKNNKYIYNYDHNAKIICVRKKKRGGANG